MTFTISEFLAGFIAGGVTTIVGLVIFGLTVNRKKK